MRKFLDGLEKTLAVYFIEKAPSLPESIKNLSVKALPILIILDIIILTLALIFIISAGLFGASWMMMSMPAHTPYMGFSLLVNGIFIIISLTFLIKAYSPIAKREYFGWRLLYYLTVIYLAGQLIFFNLLNFIVMGTLSFYLLFQIREYYK